MAIDIDQLRSVISRMEALRVEKLEQLARLEAQADATLEEHCQWREQLPGSG